MERIGPGSQRTEDINNRISERNQPSSQLQPQYGIRSVSTKYAMMPIFDRRAIPTVSIQTEPTYDICTTFNPGTAQAPWSGFACNINNESMLRNQFFALQRGAGQAAYIPPKNSNMYEHTIPQSANQIQQPFPSLFEKQTFEEFNPCPYGNGTNFFENCTRQQIKELK